MENFSISSDGLKLAATIFRPKDKKDKHPAILVIQGWTGERRRSFQYAMSLAQVGYICLLVDLRGHGDSEGDANISTAEQFLSDALATYDYLQKVDGIDPENISAVGSSFGGYIVAILSSKRKIKNLLLRAPANYPNNTFKGLTRLTGSENPGVIDWRKQKLKPDETYALEAAHNFKGNVLIIESEKDYHVPHQTLANYANAVKDKSKLTHVVMKNAPHSIQEVKFRDEVEKIYANWFRKLSL